MQIAFSFLICFPSLSKTRQHPTHHHIMHNTQHNVLQIWSAQERAVKWRNKWKNEWVKEHCSDMSKVTQRPVWSKSRMKALGCKSGHKMMLLSLVAKSWDETITTNGTKKPNLDLLSGSCFVGDTWQIPYLGFHLHTDWNLIKFLTKVVKGNAQWLQMQCLCQYPASVVHPFSTLPPNIY